MTDKRTANKGKHETDQSIVLMPIVLLQALIMAVGVLATVGLVLVLLLSFSILLFS